MQVETLSKRLRLSQSAAAYGVVVGAGVEAGVEVAAGVAAGVVVAAGAEVAAGVAAGVVAGADEVLVEAAGVELGAVAVFPPYMNQAMISTATTNAPTMKYNVLLEDGRGEPGRLSRLVIANPPLASDDAPATPRRSLRSSAG